jgi:signal transduction histidine kinase/class 3 adenylate cyclase
MEIRPMEIRYYVSSVLFCVIALYCGLLYVRRRSEPAYLWFAGMVASIGVYQARVWMPESWTESPWIECIWAGLPSLAMPCLLLFVQTFLRRPRTRFLKVAVGVLFAMSPLVVVGYAIGQPRIAIAVAAFPALLAVLPQPWIAVREARSGDPEARIVSYGLVFFGVALVFRILAFAKIGFAVALYDAGLSMTVGLTGMVMAMAWALTTRFTRAMAQLDSLNQELEQRVSERTEDLSRANARLQEADRDKTRFFSNVSHELRTPLTLIVGPLEGMLANPTQMPTAMHRPLDAMLRNGQRLLRLINQLLDVTRLDAASMGLRLARHDVAAQVRRAGAAFESFAARKDISLDVATEPDSFFAGVDGDHLDKVLFNLLSNAVKFTPRGGRIRLTAGLGDDDTVQIEVRDSGRGIPADELAHVFDRFHQVDGSTTREQEGTGIGLSLVAQLIELHDGTIRVASEPGFGTTFTVVLPHRADVTASPADVEETLTISTELATAEMTPAALAVEPAPVVLPAGAETILIVDDNPDIRSYLRDILAGTWHLREAVNGRAGVEAAKTHQPDLVVSDVMMPELDGYALCRLLKTDPETDHIPVILLTAKASSEMRVEGLEAGADDYMGKPFNAVELRARIRNLLRLRAQERQLKLLAGNLEEKVRTQLTTIDRGARLARYFPKSVVQRILAGDEAPRVAAERRQLTILFSDLVGFTSLSDNTAPERITSLLNDYLGEMVAVIERHGGVLDKIMGDGIMALWGATEVMTPTDQARAAVRAAIEMQQRLGPLQEKWRSEGLDQELQARIGIHQDYVTVGDFGSEDLVTFTAIGGGVNTAARLEANCEPGRVQVSYSIYGALSQEFPWGELQERTYKGLRPMRVSTLDPDALAQPSGSPAPKA